MTSTDQTVRIHAGNSITLNFTIIDANGDVVDLSTATQIEWVLQEDVHSEQRLLYKSVANGGIINGGPTGVISIDLDPTDTQELGGNYYHECEIAMNGKDTTVFTGRFEIEPTAIV